MNCFPSLSQSGRPWFVESMVLNRLKRIKLLILDIDGVLTDGGIVYNDNAVETKVFNVKDGLGISLLMEAGIDLNIAASQPGKSELIYHVPRIIKINDFLYRGHPIITLSVI